MSEKIVDQSRVGMQRKQESVSNQRTNMIYICIILSCSFGLICIHSIVFFLIVLCGSATLVFSILLNATCTSLLYLYVGHIILPECLCIICIILLPEN